MSRVLMLVEGQTERAIVDRVLAPDLGRKGVYVFPRVVGKPGHKGGNRFSSVRRELNLLIRQESDSIVTMFFGYYGLGILSMKRHKRLTPELRERRTPRDERVEFIRQILSMMKNQTDPKRLTPELRERRTPRDERVEFIRQDFINDEESDRS